MLKHLLALFIKIKQHRYKYVLPYFYVFKLPNEVHTPVVCFGENRDVPLFVAVGNRGIVFPEYAWDGCTPKLRVSWWLGEWRHKIFGVPDGHKIVHYNKHRFSYNTLSVVMKVLRERSGVVSSIRTLWYDHEAPLLTKALSNYDQLDLDETVYAEKLYFASLEHDVLTQFQHSLPQNFTRKLIDIHFWGAMEKANWKHSELYYKGVRAWAIIRGLK